MQPTTCASAALPPPAPAFATKGPSCTSTPPPRPSDLKLPQSPTGPALPHGPPVCATFHLGELPPHVDASSQTSTPLSCCVQPPHPASVMNCVAMSFSPPSAAILIALLQSIRPPSFDRLSCPCSYHPPCAALKPASSRIISGTTVRTTVVAPARIACSMRAKHVRASPPTSARPVPVTLATSTTSPCRNSSDPPAVQLPSSQPALTSSTPSFSAALANGLISEPPSYNTIRNSLPSFGKPPASALSPPSPSSPAIDLPVSNSPGPALSWPSSTTIPAATCLSSSTTSCPSPTATRYCPPSVSLPQKPPLPTSTTIPSLSPSLDPSHTAASTPTSISPLT